MYLRRGYGRLRRWASEFLVYILQGYQNQGLGTFLTKAILAEAKRKGF